MTPQNATQESPASGLRKLLVNAGSMFTSDTVNRASTFLLYALVGRYLGVEEFGQLSLALTLYYPAQVLAIAGTRILVTRQIARDKSKTDAYFANASAIVVIFSLISIISLMIWAWLSTYSRESTLVIFLASLALIPDTLSIVCEAVLQAWERMHFIAYANISGNVLKVALTAFLISRGHSLWWLVLTLVAAQTMVVTLEWIFLFQYVIRPRLKVTVKFCWSIIKASRIFLGVSIVIAVTSSIDTLLLAKLSNEVQVGVYGAAKQLTVPIMMIYQTFILAFFPIMCKRFDSGINDLRRTAEHVIEILLTITIPLMVGLFFQADWVLLTFYGKESFLPASIALRIMIVSLIFTAMTSVLGQVLFASLREKRTFQIVVFDSIVTLGVGIIFVAQFGFIGAAITLLIVRAVTRLISSISFGKLIWKPALASGAMAIFLLFSNSLNPWLTIGAGTLIYVSMWFLLATWSAGGVHRLIMRYAFIWS